MWCGNALDHRDAGGLQARRPCWIVGEQPDLGRSRAPAASPPHGHSRARRRQSRAGDWRRPCRARGPAASKRGSCWPGRSRGPPAEGRAGPRRRLSPMMCSASLSCGPQSHFSDPNTSPVRHSLCSRTSGGLPPNAPTIRATCSCPSSDARNATIWVGGMSSSGSLARATISTDGCRRSRRCPRPRRASATFGSSNHTAGSSPADRARSSAARAVVDAFGRQRAGADRAVRGRDPARDRRSPAPLPRRARAHARSAPAAPGRRRPAHWRD